MRYIQPGMPAPPPPPTQTNSYVQPGAPPLQSVPPPPTQPSPEPSRQPQPLPQGTQGNRRSKPAGTTLNVVNAEWRLRHGDGWIRADDLHPAIRQMIDPQDRAPAIRQRLRLLAAKHRELEAKVVGNAAKPVAYYRLIESEPAGLEGSAGLEGLASPA